MLSNLWLIYSCTQPGNNLRSIKVLYPPKSTPSFTELWTPSAAAFSCPGLKEELRLVRKAKDSVIRALAIEDEDLRRIKHKFEATLLSFSPPNPLESQDDLENKCVFLPSKNAPFDRHGDSLLGIRWNKLPRWRWILRWKLEFNWTKFDSWVKMSWMVEGCYLLILYTSFPRNLKILVCFASASLVHASNS